MRRKVLWSVVLLSVVLLVTLPYQRDLYRAVLRFYRTHIIGMSGTEAVSLAEQEKIDTILSRHEGHLFGIDVSEYQGNIKWSAIQFMGDSTPIDFVICRASMGS